MTFTVHFKGEMRSEDSHVFPISICSNKNANRSLFSEYDDYSYVANQNNLIVLAVHLTRSMSPLVINLIPPLHSLIR